MPFQEDLRSNDSFAFRSSTSRKAILQIIFYKLEYVGIKRDEWKK